MKDAPSLNIMLMENECISGDIVKIETFKIECCINVKSAGARVLTDGKIYEVISIRFYAGRASFKVIDDMGIDRYYDANYFENIELML